MGHSISNCKKNLPADDLIKDPVVQKNSRKRSLQYVPKSVKEPGAGIKMSTNSITAVDKGKQIVQDDEPNKSNGTNGDLFNVAGPSNSKLISFETIIGRAGFIGVNNVPLSDKEAQNSINHLLGFLQLDFSTENVASSLIHKVLDNQVDANGVSPPQDVHQAENEMEVDNALEGVLPGLNVVVFVSRKDSLSSSE